MEICDNTSSILYIFDLSITKHFLNSGDLIGSRIESANGGIVHPSTFTREVKEKWWVGGLQILLWFLYQKRTSFCHLVNEKVGEYSISTVNSRVHLEKEMMTK